VLSAVSVSPYVTPYRIVLAPRTFVLCVVLVCGVRVLARVRLWHPGWTPLMTGLAAAAFFASALLQTLPSYDGRYNGFLHIARDVAAAAPFLQERPDLAGSLIVNDSGYDGQFMYLMAFDPWLRRFADRPQAYRAFIDNPPYRYGRIGFSSLTHLVAVGKPEWFPAVMMWLIVAAHLALGTLLGSVAARHGLSPAAGLWYLAIPAFQSSLMSALPEALAAAGLVAGFASWESRRPWLAAVCFGAALLVRETGIVLLIAIVVASGSGHWRRSAAVAAAAVMPMAAWRLFVASRFYADFGFAAIVTNPADLGVPLAGLLDLWRAAASGSQPAPETVGAWLFPIFLLTALALSALALRRTENAESRALAGAAVIYGSVAVSLNYDKIWSHLPSGERGTFELFLCLLLLLLQGDRQPSKIRYALVGMFVALCAYTFLAAPDASTSRTALLLIR